MRIKILMLGNDPESIVADGQLLRDHGMLVLTSFNLQNAAELITEIKPDVIFFDAQLPNNRITESYNDIVNKAEFAKIPIIFTLSEDDMYLVTGKRTGADEKKNMISDNIISAVKMALQSNKTYHKKAGDMKRPHGGAYGAALHTKAAQLTLPIYFR